MCCKFFKNFVAGAVITGGTAFATSTAAVATLAGIARQPNSKYSEGYNNGYSAAMVDYNVTGPQNTFGRMESSATAPLLVALAITIPLSAGAAIVGRFSFAAYRACCPDNNSTQHSGYSKVPNGDQELEHATTAAIQEQIS